jgi:hypothetical protein
MRPLPYRVFLWVFAFSNGVIWFGILFALGLFVQSRFAVEGALSWGTALRALWLALIFPMVLAVQGGIVNLRAQFLLGRFVLPVNCGTANGVVRNPWWPAVVGGTAGWVMCLPVLVIGVRLLGTQGSQGVQFATILAGAGAVAMLLPVVIISDRELRCYARSIERPARARLPAGVYVLRNIALPWGVINLVINAVLAWVTYHQGPLHAAAGVAWEDLRLDLVVMSFLISVFMGLSALPEVETDFRRNLVWLPGDLPRMPRLWIRYAYALGIAALMYVTVTVTAAAVGSAATALGFAVLAKGVAAGVVAGGASGACAVWGLSRCAERRGEPEALALAAGAL